mmetsp:Transcript_22002/g.60266  ORF Transcript_22002/g.60266 Transcript_22002/m.60266 type:complete len:124 (+) Transcript_22002:697-1068(+)
MPALYAKMLNKSNAVPTSRALTAVRFLVSATLFANGTRDPRSHFQGESVQTITVFDCRLFYTFSNRDVHSVPLSWKVFCLILFWIGCGVMIINRLPFLTRPVTESILQFLYGALDVSFRPPTR